MVDSPNNLADAKPAIDERKDLKPISAVVATIEFLFYPRPKGMTKRSRYIGNLVRH